MALYIDAQATQEQQQALIDAWGGRLPDLTSERSPRVHADDSAGQLPSPRRPVIRWPWALVAAAWGLAAAAVLTNQGT